LGGESVVVFALGFLPGLGVSLGDALHGVLDLGGEVIGLGADQSGGS
jgi:hypothetical protein